MVDTMQKEMKCECHRMIGKKIVNVEKESVEDVFQQRPNKVAGEEA